MAISTPPIIAAPINRYSRMNSTGAGLTPIPIISSTATATTGKMIIDATGLRIDCLLPGSTGGEQQIAARVSYNEIDLVLMFRDPMEKYQNDAQINDLLRSCDQNCIPVATNVATAEMLIQGLARGDLAWREINPNANF